METSTSINYLEDKLSDIEATRRIALKKTLATSSGLCLLGAIAAVSLMLNEPKYESTHLPLITLFLLAESLTAQSFFGIVYESLLVAYKKGKGLD